MPEAVLFNIVKRNKSFLLFQFVPPKPKPKPEQMGFQAAGEGAVFSSFGFEIKENNSFLENINGFVFRAAIKMYPLDKSCPAAIVMIVEKCEIIVSEFQKIIFTNVYVKS